MNTLLRTIMLSAVAAPVAAQSASKVPVRQLPAAVVTSPETFGSIAAVRQLPNGRVLVNDQANRRVLLMDSTLKILDVVADSTSKTANAYGGRAGGLIAYRGDSTLFVDPASLSMLVIDPAGKVQRVMAAPRPNDVQFLVGGAFGNPGFDAKGRLVYRSFFRPAFTMSAAGGPMQMPAIPDTAALVRFDLASRTLDTVGFFKIPRPNMTMSQDANGNMRMTSTVNPLPVVDEWAVMSDGTIAIVRGRDYRVEFIGADGARTVSDKIPYEWQRLTDEDKVAFIDSTKAAMERMRATAAASGTPGTPGAAAAGGAAAAAAGALGGVEGGGRQVVTMTMRGDGPPQVSAGAPPGGVPAPNYVSPSELPDYKPVFGPGSVRADMDGRLWVRTIPTKPTPGVLYEVIDRSGKLVDRVLVPAGTAIAGFGQGGVVYLGMRDAKGIHLLKAHM